MLQTLKSLYPDLQLLVPGILGKLLHEHVTLEEPSAISLESHILCWGYDDGMVQDGKEGSGVPVCECACVCACVCVSVCMCVCVCVCMCVICE